MAKKTPPVNKTVKKAAEKKTTQVDLERQLKIQKVLYEIADAASAVRDMYSFYKKLHKIVGKLMYAENFFISLYDAQSDLISFPYRVDTADVEPPAPQHLTEQHGATAWVIQHGEALDRTSGRFDAAIARGEMEQVGTKSNGIVVPLKSENKTIGALSVQSYTDGIIYDAQDVELLTFVAQHISTALTRARAIEETRQRNTELQIINSIQQGLAAELDFQAIVDLVGNKLREVFHTPNLNITWYDEKSNLIHYLYIYEHGKPVTVDPQPPRPGGIFETLIRTRQPIVLNTIEELTKLNAIAPLPGTAVSKSSIEVPIVSSDRVLGGIGIDNFERENAFGESQLRLLTTIAASLGTALENARLFDETQLLLKETEESNAELAVINSVQQALAAELDMQGIYDAVGDKIREIFDAQGVFISTLDHESRLGIFNYFYEIGERFHPGPVPFSGMMEHIAETGEMVVINANMVEESEPYRLHIPAGVAPKSGVWMPIKSSGRTQGIVSLQNLDREHAFSDSDIRLLQTLANAMSVALENARLFDETQLLLKETEQRNAELAIINSVQQGLSSKLEMQAIYELVGDKIQEIFNAQSVLIATFDRASGLASIPYNFEMGQRFSTNPYPFTGLHKELMQHGKTVLINENAEQKIKEMGMVQLSGTQVSKSLLFVPLNSGNEVNGAISLQNIEREHAFSEADVRLLETLASSMSVALENASLFDETQRLFLEAKEARTAAEQADQAKSAFLSSMSHELRTPLNAIINFVEMVARGMIGPVNQEQVELLDQALYSSKHLLNLINDVLDISKIQAGQLTLFIEDEVSVQVIIETTLSIVGGLLQEKNLQLIRDIDPHLPMISCDRRRLRQVLLNLISNAIKFTDKGTITVSVKNQGQDLLFAVIDTGLGIPPDKQDLIFEPFIQTENGERQLQGTGLGLPISRSLIRAHGGKLWVESEGGEGSAFL